MESSVSPCISSSMRPSKSLISQVKNTLSGLVSSVFKRKSSSAPGVVENSIQENHSVKEDGDSVIKRNTSFTNGDSTRPTSKSHYLRSNEAFQKRLKSFTVIIFITFVVICIIHLFVKFTFY